MVVGHKMVSFGNYILDSLIRNWHRFGRQVSAVYIAIGLFWHPSYGGPLNTSRHVSSSSVEKLLRETNIGLLFAAFGNAIALLILLRRRK
jgi:hypothetical protein